MSTYLGLLGLPAQLKREDFAARVVKLLRLSADRGVLELQRSLKLTHTFSVSRLEFLLSLTRNRKDDSACYYPAHNVRDTHLLILHTR